MKDFYRTPSSLVVVCVSAILVSLVLAPTDSTAASTLDPQLADCIDLVEKAVPGNKALLAAIERLLTQPEHAETGRNENPTALVVSYRQRGGTVSDVVVQLYHDRGTSSNLLNADGGYITQHLGGDMLNSADSLMGMLYYQATYLGNPSSVERQQRAFTAGLSGDLTLLREQTVEPLSVVAVMPRAGKYLPGSLRTRVHGIVISSQLEFNEWKSNISLISDDEETAQQVGTLVSAWREIGVSLADTYASTAAAQPLRNALRSSSIEIIGDSVTISAAVPAQTAVRVSKELSGHGGGCPPGGVCKKDKVAICHIPPGNPGNAHTICIAPSAVPAHLAHGDYCGPCTGSGGKPKGNNGVGNGEDPQPPGNPPVNDGPGTGPGNPGNNGT